MVTFWLVFGALLMALEFLIPGLVVIFLGVSALLVAALLYLEWIEGWLAALLSWFVASTLLVLLLREFLLKLAPTGDTQTVELDDPNQWENHLVPVLEDISPEAPGRITFQGSTWPAYADQAFKKGEQAQIKNKQGLGFFVVQVADQERN